MYKEFIFTDEMIVKASKVLKGDFTEVREENRELVQRAVDAIVASLGKPDYVEVVNKLFPVIADNPNVEPYEIVLFVRLLTNQNINLTYIDFPWFKDFVVHYGKFLRAARVYKGE